MDALGLQVASPAEGCEEAYNALFSQESLGFLEKLIKSFSPAIHQLHKFRDERREALLNGLLPEFAATVEGDWKIADLPRRLQDRRMDLGDVSPADMDRLVAAMSADVQGIQVDFDDGHCPTWRNQLLGLHNVVRAVSGAVPGQTKSLLKDIPLLLLRPRAWNMTEHNITLDGYGVPGALVDFGLLMHHVGLRLYQQQSGPFFYLSKLESSFEAQLWNRIFIWTQETLGLPHGTIKACVLIENIAAVYEMDAILYELRFHSFGLNCGIWDYAASIITMLGHRPEMLLPDRVRYVDIKQPFLTTYVRLLADTCHRRGAPATGGMAPHVLALQDQTKADETVSVVVDSKLYELDLGLDGFLLYDIKLVPHLKKLWDGKRANEFLQIQPLKTWTLPAAASLLTMPPGGVTLEGLRRNMAVLILFVASWLLGRGHFQYFGAVEDSATAEISRSQIWQCLTHKVKLEDSDIQVSPDLVRKLAEDVVVKGSPNFSQPCLHTASSIVLDVFSVLQRPPQFLTSHLSDSHVFHLLASMSGLHANVVKSQL